MILGVPPTTGGGGISTTVLLVIGSILVAGLGSLATYLGVRRPTQGTPKTSTAGDLWDAADKLRKDVTARLEATEAKLDKAVADADAARQAAIQWQNRYEDSQAEMSKMRRQIRILENQMKELRGEK